MKRRYAAPRPQLGARVRPETAERIRRFVGMTGVPLQEVVDLAINTWLDQMEAAAYGAVPEDE